MVIESVGSRLTAPRWWYVEYWDGRKWHPYSKHLLLKDAHIAQDKAIAEAPRGSGRVVDCTMTRNVQPDWVARVPSWVQMLARTNGAAYGLRITQYCIKGHTDRVAWARALRMWRQIS